MMLNLKEGMTAEEVVGAYQKAVNDFRNQIDRVPARVEKNPALAVEKYAKKLYKEVKHLLHPSYMEQYLVNYQKILAEREAKSQEFMKNVAKQRANGL